MPCNNNSNNNNGNGSMSTHFLKRTFQLIWHFAVFASQCFFCFLIQMQKNYCMNSEAHFNSFWKQFNSGEEGHLSSNNPNNHQGASPEPEYYSQFTRKEFKLELTNMLSSTMCRNITKKLHALYKESTLLILVNPLWAIFYKANATIIIIIDSYKDNCKHS